MFNILRVVRPTLLSKRPRQQHALSGSGFLRQHRRNDLPRYLALILSLIGLLFVYLAYREDGWLGTSAHYLTVALVAFVNAALCAADDFVEE